MIVFALNPAHQAQQPYTIQGETKVPRHKEFSTADLRRLSQIRIRTFHRRDAEYAEEIPFAQSGDDDWAKTYSSDLGNVFVCRRLPTNKKLILCALCVSAVISLIRNRNFHREFQISFPRFKP